MRCSRDRVSAHIRPMFPVLGAISGWNSTTCSMPESFAGADPNQARSRIAFPDHVDQFRRASIQPVNQVLPPKAIVLVDDEKSYNDLIRQMLAENLDCPIHGFTQPLEALDHIVALNPGVVVTDYFMPEMNGIEFIQRAAPLVPKATFLMISGNNLVSEQPRMDKLASLKGFLA